MAGIGEQVHAKFKVFAGELDRNKTLGALGQEIAAWAEQRRVAPKSIGIEYLEAAKRIVVTLGYRDDEPGYRIELHTVALGKSDAFGADFSALEQAMAAAAAKLTNIICHELYITENHEFLMVFMTHRQ